ncbi:MAG: hypothetical protein FWE94_04860 [Coriobacteriia bacterium]|nr:hypothetical protein [Coriobacteriia bacterium]
MAGKRNKNVPLPLLAVLAIAGVLLIGCSATCVLSGLAKNLIMGGSPSYHLWEKILDYCETHEEIRLSDVTDFDWDVAYVDPEPYGKGERLKEKYHIEGKLSESNGTRRIAFCKDGRLVLEFFHVSAGAFRLSLDPSVEIIHPDSVFEAEWVPMASQSGEEYLHLTPKQEQDAAPLSGDVDAG